MESLRGATCPVWSWTESKEKMMAGSSGWCVTSEKEGPGSGKEGPDAEENGAVYGLGDWTSVAGPKS